MNRNSKEDPKTEIRRVAETYRNENGVINLSKLRNEQLNIYSKISYHFGSINGFLADMENYKNPNVDNKDFVVTREVIRNRLTWDRLQELRDKNGDNMTFDEIGLMYGKSKVYMARLYKDLESVFASDDNVINPESGTTLNRGVIRNRLAWDRLFNLHSPEGEDMTFEDIGLMYGKTGEYMEIFYKDFEKVFAGKQINEMAEVEFSDELI